ncbi:MAG TPA: molybdopterin-dependent oxidoreductase [Thermoanaerobaculia bacterium]|nr:molybdopterin-dependent oxidoreductase [Thermoanaerobaculia bacterium]
MVKDDGPEEVRPATPPREEEPAAASESGHAGDSVALAAKEEAGPPLEASAPKPSEADTSATAHEPRAAAAEVPRATERAPQRARVSLAARIAEPPEEPLELPARLLASRSRRDFLIFGAGAALAAAGFWWLLPGDTRQRHLTPALRDWLDSLDARLGATPERREQFLNGVLTFDDDVAEALYSENRTVRTYPKSRITELRNNYNGATPGPDYLPGWTLTVSGLASGRVERFSIGNLLSRFARHEQVTRLCCVEGWSAIAWWGGLRFCDFLAAYPPAAGARWARLDSSVNLDSGGNPDRYYVSIDLPTARHPQTLLATQHNGRPLSLEHGAPLRLVAPMKLGLKNIKAVTSIVYSVEEPADYWNERGYSRYDGL